MRLTMFRLNDDRPVRVPSISRQEILPPCRRPTYFDDLPTYHFGFGVSALFHRFRYHGTYDDSLALTMPVSSGAGSTFRLVPETLSCLAYAVFVAKVVAAGVGDSLIRGQKKEGFWELFLSFNRPHVAHAGTESGGSRELAPIILNDLISRYRAK